MIGARRPSLPRGSLLIAALLVAGCATGQPLVSFETGAPTDTRSSTEYRRCSAADPDRYGWFCFIGRIVYATLAGMQPDPGPGLR